MDYQADTSGINSLAGFAYQIKVFAYYAFDLEENTSVEFETIEDVNFKNIAPSDIDVQSHNFLCKKIDKTSNIAIQVKHTSVNKTVAQQMIFNWLLLEQSNHKIEKYVLFTEKSYKNNDNIFFEDAKILHQIVMKSQKGASAKITKLKEAYQDISLFETKYADIKSKFEFIDLDNIDIAISNKASLHFRKADNSMIFGQRLCEFLQHITVRILDAIQSKNPFILKYAEFISIIEDISKRFTLEVTAPCYADFKKVNNVDLNNSVLSSSREFIQLKACELPENLIKQHLLYGMYYHTASLKYMENNRVSRIENIEVTTFENFESSQLALNRTNSDTPYNRLEETKKRSNAYADNEQIKYGSCIYLTKDNIGENQISWKDEEDA